MLSFLGDLFTFVIAFAAVIGFLVMLSVAVEYLDERDALVSTGNNIATAGRTAEDNIDDLRDEAIGDMFDVARQVRLQRHVGVNDEGGAQ